MNPRLALAAALALTVAASAGAQAPPQSPKIGKPLPAPPVPSTIPPLPPAAYDPGLDIGGQELQARQVETRLTVPVLVNGQGPFDFIVDSGADTSVVGIRIARALNLPVGEPAILNAMTSRNLVARVKVDQLTVGSTTFADLQLPALRESHVGGAGMIGIDALVRQRLLLDFEKRLIKVEDARVRERTLPGDIVVTARSYRGQLILTHVRAAGLSLDAVIDTGTQVTIGNSLLREKLLRKHRDKFFTVEVTGVTGVTMKMELARIPELHLGPITLQDVPIAFADVPPFELFGLANEPALLLGTDLLEAFRRVSLDFRARKVRFQLKRCSPQGIYVSTWPQDVTRLSSTRTHDVCDR